MISGMIRKPWWCLLVLSFEIHQKGFHIWGDYFQKGCMSMFEERGGKGEWIYSAKVCKQANKLHTVGIFFYCSTSSLTTGDNQYKYWLCCCLVIMEAFSWCLPSDELNNQTVRWQEDPASAPPVSNTNRCHTGTIRGPLIVLHYCA